MSDGEYLEAKHCGRTGCTCLHVYCDKGFEYVWPRKVEVHGPTLPPEGKVVEYERVKPCATCRPEAYDAMLRSSSRHDWMRRLRALRPGKPGE